MSSSQGNVDGVHLGNLRSGSSISDNSQLSEAQEAIDHKLPHFFGARAALYQKSIVRGRHPVSIPKDSELWHYSKISAERRTRILRGHHFWDVINDTSWERNTDKVLNGKTNSKLINRFQQHDSSKRPPPSTASSAGEDNDGEKHLLRGSLQSQLKAAMAAQNDLNIKLDFNKKGTINYGMTFIIMNFANEVLYVDKSGEMRTKPMSEIQPTDRIKFKMVDLLNPSNPRAVKYGQSAWLQCLDPAENADNSLQAGSVLTTKLFGPPELEAVHFADSYSQLIMNKDSKHGAGESLHEKSLRNLSDFNERLRARRRLSLSSIDSSFPDAKEGEEGDADVDAVDLDSQPKDPTADGSNTARDVDNEEYDADMAGKDVGSIGSDLRRRFEDSAKAANLCGHVGLNRIVEMRKEGNHASEGFMSDEKALRYNSKQSMHLGKWSIQPARREDSHIKHFDDDEDNKAGNNSTNTANTGVQHHFVSSLTPIVIQQDHYCLSTAPSVEHHHWPPNSSTIVRQSSHINADLAEEYERKYAKALINNINTDHSTQTNASLVTNHKHFENKKKLYFMTSKTFERGNTLRSGSGRESSTPISSDNHASSMLQEDQFACVRKIVHRSAPYDFIVDRRCVWKICLFEQFAESYVALTGKEKQVQKVMETATMALKLSKLNREGARKHMNNCHIKVGSSSLHSHLLEGGSVNTMPSSVSTTASASLDDLPPLLGGESFARTIREITFKTASFTEDAYLKHRRNKEAKLTEYFSGKIHDVLETEKQRPHLSHNNSMSSLDSHSQGGGFDGRSPVGSVSKDSKKSVKFFATEGDGIDDADAYRVDNWDNLDFLQSGSDRPADGSQNKVPKTHNRALLLTSAESVSDFRDLSAGEQLLSMHKTFGHLNKAALVSVAVDFFLSLHRFISDQYRFAGNHQCAEEIKFLQTKSNFCWGPEEDGNAAISR